MPEEYGLYGVFALLGGDVCSHSAVTVLRPRQVRIVLSVVQNTFLNALSDVRDVKRSNVSDFQNIPDFQETAYTDT